MGAVSLSLATTVQTARLLRYFVPISHSAGNGLDGGANADYREVAFEGQTITISGAPPAAINYRFGLSYFRNVTLAGVTSNSTPFRSLGTTRGQVALALGVVATDAAAVSANFYQALIGCDLARLSFTDHAATVNDLQDGSVLANNRLLDLRATFTIAGSQPHAERGAAIVQNVFERAVVINSAALQIGADEVVQPFSNIVEMYNTVPGRDSTARTNRAYTSDAGAVGVEKRITSRFNLWYEYNCKSDTFTNVSGVSGRTGNWRNRYTVGHLGNVSLVGSASGGAPDPLGSSWLGERWPAATFNVGAANVTWADNRSGTTGVGGGNYALTGETNAAYGRVPAGAAGLRFAINGWARRDDGTGAAGAFERAL